MCHRVLTGAFTFVTGQSSYRGGTYPRYKAQSKTRDQLIDSSQNSEAKHRLSLELESFLQGHQPQKYLDTATPVGYQVLLSCRGEPWHYAG